MLPAAPHFLPLPPLWPHIPPMPRGTHLGGCGVKGHVEDVGSLPGVAGMQDVIGVSHGVLQHHNLPEGCEGARTILGHPLSWGTQCPLLGVTSSLGWGHSTCWALPAVNGAN